jgi:hypothetical protein
VVRNEIKITPEVSCGTLVGDLNNPLGSQTARKEKGRQPLSHRQFGKNQKNLLKITIGIIYF